MAENSVYRRREDEEKEQDIVNCSTCKYHGFFCSQGYTNEECGEESGFPYWEYYRY